MVLGQVEVAEHEKIFLGQHLVLFKLQSLLKQHISSQEPKIITLGGCYVTSGMIVARKIQNTSMPKI